MAGFLGLGGSGGQSKSKTASSSKLWFPTQFADQFETRYGTPPPYTEDAFGRYMGRNDRSVWQGSSTSPFGDAGPGPGLRNLGFGTPYQNVTAPQAGQTILGPTAQAGQVRANIQNGDWNRYEQALYRSQADPVIRELQRQQGLQTGQMQSQLAGAGLASSGTGIGQMQRLGREFGQRMTSASEDAVQRAVATRYGEQSKQELTNATIEAQRQIANADQANQMTGLAGKLSQERNLANAELENKTNYLNQQGLSDARAKFLDLVGVDQKDLARMDERQLKQLDLMMQNYISLLSTYGGFGNQVQRGRTTGSNWNLGGSASYSTPK